MKVLIITFAILFSGCAIFQSGEDRNDDSESSDEVEEVYIFDEVPEDSDESKNEDEIKALKEELDKTENKDTSEEVNVFGETVSDQAQETTGESRSYYLQLGAFSSLKGAEDYVSKIESQVPFNLSIMYNSQTSLYHVRSYAYSTREEVEALRQDFWSKNLFKDAFIVTE